VPWLILTGALPVMAVVGGVGQVHGGRRTRWIHVACGLSTSTRREVIVRRKPRWR